VTLREQHEALSRERLPSVPERATAKWADLTERVSETLPLGLHVVVGLEVQPEVVAGTEVAGEAEGGVSSDPARAVDDFVDPPRRDTDGDGHTVLRDAQRDDVLLLEDLTGMDGGVQGAGHGVVPSVVVDDLYVLGAGRRPVEADAPLVVDPDAVSTSPVTAKLLQPVTRRDPKIIERPGSVEDEQLPMCCPVDFDPERTGPSAMPDSLGIPVAKRQHTPHDGNG